VGRRAQRAAAGPQRGLNNITDDFAIKDDARPSHGGAVRVLVADAYAATRAGVRAALEPHGFTVVAESADAPGTLAAAMLEQPDICLVSLALPGGGDRAMRTICKSLPGVRVVALTEDDSDGAVIAAVAAGATGYVTRASAVERLPDTLRAALDRYAFVPELILSRLARRAQRERRGELWRSTPRLGLSPRERQVLEALRDGASTADIASELGLSTVTVRRHISGVIRKAGVRDREALQELLAARGG
jgi:DNA-binding NarL/FixJ family response regulator